MKWGRRPSPALIWAVRELMRHPAQAVALFAALSTTIALVGVVLLFNQSITHTCISLLKASPAVVVRRVNAGGWVPLPMDEALAHARIPGVLQPRPRVWGVALTQAGTPVTVVGQPSDSGAVKGADQFHNPVYSSLQGLSLGLTPGQALLGPEVQTDNGIDHLRLVGRLEMDLQVVGRLPAESSLAGHDVVVVHGADARRLLGLSPDQASDLALDVFREEEVAAVCDDLAEAFPWPVQVTTRGARQELCLDTAQRRSAMILFSFVPVLLALACLLLATRSRGVRQRRYLGLLKALGWTAGDILRLQGYGIGFLALCALVTGFGAAYGLLFWPPMAGWLGVWFGWSGPTVLLRPGDGGVLGTFGLTLLLVVAPFVGVALWSVRSAALADPGDLLQA